MKTIILHANQPVFTSILTSTCPCVVATQNVQRLGPGLRVPSHLSSASPHPELHVTQEWESCDSPHKVNMVHQGLRSSSFSSALAGESSLERSSWRSGFSWTLSFQRKKTEQVSSTEPPFFGAERTPARLSGAWQNLLTQTPSIWWTGSERAQSSPGGQARTEPTPCSVAHECAKSPVRTFARIHVSQSLPWLCRSAGDQTTCHRTGQQNRRPHRGVLRYWKHGHVLSLMVEATPARHTEWNTAKHLIPPKKTQPNTWLI